MPMKRLPSALPTLWFVVAAGIMAGCAAAGSCRLPSPMLAMAMLPV